jgi:hypothetical protein
MVSDTAVVQLAAAGLLALGLVCNAAAGTLFPSRGRIGTISRENALAWSPRGLGGSGDEGSPLFGLMWGLIFTLQGVSTVLVVVFTLLNGALEDIFALFNGLACAAAALTLCAAWQPVFVVNEAWAFALAAALLVLAAALATVGAIAGKAFLVDEWWAAVAGASTQLFAGWLLVAAGLGIGITTRAYNRGVGTKTVDPGVSLFPLVLACVACALAAVFAIPLIAVPLTLTFAFIPGVLRDWRLYTALLVALAGVVVGAAMIAVYRGAGAWF